MVSWLRHAAFQKALSKEVLAGFISVTVMVIAMLEATIIVACGAAAVDDKRGIDADLDSHGDDFLRAGRKYW